MIVHPLEKAGELLPEFRRIANAAPDELTVWTVMRKAPPLPFLPEEWHGREVLIFAACYSGAVKEGEEAVRPLRALGSPIADVISPHPFVGWQAAFDPLLTPGARNYWKSHDFADLSAGAIGVMVDAARNLPSPECEIFIAHIGGAMARVPADATAWSNRDAHFIMNAHGRWRDKQQGFSLHRMGSSVVRRCRALRVRKRLRQFHAGGRRRPGRAGVWRQLSPPGRDQAALRPRQSVPHEPEHPADGVRRRADGEAPAPIFMDRHDMRLEASGGRRRAAARWGSAYALAYAGVL